MEQATLGGGCFWCLEAVFEQLVGVDRVISGYAGGAVTNSAYEDVCTGRTGHAEVINIHFDPQLVSYRTLLDVFFATHDPTTLNRQGADTGTQYRSVIFVHSPEQRKIAEELIDDLESVSAFASPIVTEITDAPVFYPAEAYHQGYFRNNPEQGYCAFVVAPKAAATRRKFAELLKPECR